MGNCTYYEICGLPDEDDPTQHLCILHSQIPGKDRLKFARALRNHRSEKSDNFTFFVFPEDFYFQKTTFVKRANFHGAIFTQRGIFEQAKFTEVAEFNEAEFRKGASFRRAKFGGRAEFILAKFFEARSSFSMAEFDEEADFRFAKFTERATFRGVKFRSGQAVFSNTEFNDGVDFQWADFSNGASFEGTIFQGDKVNFQYSSFRGRSIFVFRRREKGQGGEEGGEVDKEEKEEVTEIFSEVREVNFREVIIDPPNALAFVEADLGKCLFQGTNLEKVRFTAVRWPTVNHRIGVHDEKSLEEENTGSWEQVERLYRELKKNYEDDRDYERAGDFHYGEKEMRRRNPETSMGLRIMLTLYWLLSGYGEKYLRPIICVSILLISSTFFYIVFGLLPKGGEPKLSLMNLYDWLRATHYGIRVMTLLKPDDLIPIGYAKVINTIQSILGPIFIGFFGLALRQRLRR